MSDDVVVIGRLLPLAFAGTGAGSGGGGGTPGSSGWSGLYAEYPTDHPDEAVDNPYDNGPSIEANYEIIPLDVQNAINRFNITLNNISNLIYYVNPHYDPKNFYDFHLDDGRMIYRGELSANLSRFTFIVEPNKTFPPLFGGQMINRANGNGFVSEIAPKPCLDMMPITS